MPINEGSGTQEAFCAVKFLLESVGDPKIGEFVQAGFTILSAQQCLTVDDIQKLKSQETASHFKTAGYPVLKKKQGLPGEWCDDGGYPRYYTSTLQFLDEEYYLTKELKPRCWVPFLDFFKKKGVACALILNKIHFNNNPSDEEKRQKIAYGAPGSGKSDGIERKLREEQIVPIRTTFHPDSDYQSFVGAYKPFMKKVQRVVYVNDGKTAQLVEGPDALKDEEVIAYEFRPQAFTDAYVQAWKAKVAGETKPVVLVIEEINRGDCAKIFGDLFQLLDRDDTTGFSKYPIVADRDLRDYLEKKFNTSTFQGLASMEGVAAGDWSDVKTGKKLVLPPNLYIWATMNTSDQSLFPMDSAFKRRWDWKYVPIRNHKEESWTIDVGAKKYDWWDFLQKVNAHIFDLTNSEDKQLGYFFVKAKDKVVSLDVFVNKVVFYLWNAIFKDCYTECDFLKDKDAHKDGSKEGSEYLVFTKFFDEDGNAKADVVQKFLDALKVDPPKSQEETDGDGEAEPTDADTQTPSGGEQLATGGETHPSETDDAQEEPQG